MRVAGLTTGLGEGPLWDAARGLLWLVDIMAHRVLAHDPASGATRVFDVGQPVGAVAPPRTASPNPTDPARSHKNRRALRWPHGTPQTRPPCHPRWIVWSLSMQYPPARAVVPAISAMINAANFDELRRQITAQVRADERTLVYLRDTIAPLQANVRRIQRRTTTAVSLVATDGGALPEVTGRDGDTVLQCKAGDVESLTAAIRRGLDDADLRARVGAAGRQRVDVEPLPHPDFTGRGRGGFRRQHPLRHGHVLGRGDL